MSGERARWIVVTLGLIGFGSVLPLLGGDAPWTSISGLGRGATDRMEAGAGSSGDGAARSSRVPADSAEAVDAAPMPKLAQNVDQRSTGSASVRGGDAAATADRARGMQAVEGIPAVKGAPAGATAVAPNAGVVVAPPLPVPAPAAQPQPVRVVVPPIRRVRPVTPPLPFATAGTPSGAAKASSAAKSRALGAAKAKSKTAR